MSTNAYAPSWIAIPAGIVMMGSDPRQAAPPFADEQPQHDVALPEFRLSRVAVTNAQYLAFVTDTQHPAPGHWLDGKPSPGSEQFPVTYISWSDAQAFCTWANVRLPSEAEWEKAARSDDGRWWPWGNDLPDHTRCHFNGHAPAAQGLSPAAQSVMAVGHLPRGASPYGVLDMAGNVWEWTNSLYRRYPYQHDDGREDRQTQGQRVVRGGSYNHDLRHIRCATRDGMAAGARDVYIGFRVVAQVAHQSNFDWVTVPEGKFLMGSNAAPPGSAALAGALPSELPQHAVQLAEFHLAQTPVINAEYAAFVWATGHPAPGHWFDGTVPADLEHHPVTHVDWHDAQAFCQWAGVRLPTEAEWEMAARGPATDGRSRLYPWGDERPNNDRLNYRRETKRTRTTPVDHFPSGASPYGVLDMAGNVWEWTSSLYAPYPYSADDGREDPHSLAQRVLRGGSFASPHARFVRCAMRSLSYPTRRREHIGFRVAH